jgi:hypothetical protein
MTHKVLDRLLLVVLGGLAFWTPAALMVWISMDNFNITLANVLSVICALCVYWLLGRLQHFQRIRLLPMYVLTGIYVLGPVVMTMATSAAKGAFASFPESARDLLWLTVISVFPPLTVLFVGDSGMILALLGMTGILIVAAVKRRSPSVK